MKKAPFLVASAAALIGTMGCAQAKSLEKTAEKTAVTDAKKTVAEHSCGAAMSKDGCCGVKMDKSHARC